MSEKIRIQHWRVQREHSLLTAVCATLAPAIIFQFLFLSLVIHFWRLLLFLLSKQWSSFFLFSDCLASVVLFSLLLQPWWLLLFNANHTQVLFLPRKAGESIKFSRVSPTLSIYSRWNEKGLLLSQQKSSKIDLGNCEIVLLMWMIKNLHFNRQKLRIN